MLKNNIFVFLDYAGMAELVDALDLGSSAVRRGGSTPFTRTALSKHFSLLFVLSFFHNQINKCIFAARLSKIKDENYTK